MTTAVAPPVAPDATDAPLDVADGLDGAPPRAPAPTSTPRTGDRLDLLRVVLVVAAVLAGGLLAQLTVVSSLQQRSQQQQLFDELRAELAQGTAPTGPLGTDGRALAIGTPVAYLEIEDLGLQQVVVSGTTSSALFAGPGHRRDSVLPGQVGASVLMGRRSSYGGPFARIDDLEEGDEIRVTTGQGVYEYEVLGVRREGDPLPPPPASGEGRLVLTTADGSPFFPSGVLRVDASLDDASSGPSRLFATDGLPAAERSMAGDTSQLWALALWLQVLTALALAVVWAWKRWGRAQTWVVCLPPVLLVGVIVAGHVVRLLPNLV